MNLSYPGKIELTNEESSLLRDIDFEVKSEFLENSADAMENLIDSLMSRNAIPEIRWEYFVDPELNIGLKKSRRQVFEDNGTKGKDIFRHPHFLNYLKYFIYGPELPKAVIDGFWKYVERGRYISGGDVDELRKFTRSSIRQHSLQSYYAKEEFYKLSLECGMSDGLARMIRDVARSVR